jgi:hypothetical protein
VSQPPAVKPDVSGHTRWLIWGSVILLSVLVLATGASLFLHAWYIQRNDYRWCSFFAVVTQQVPNDSYRVLVIELEQAEKQAGCHG